MLRLASIAALAVALVPAVVAQAPVYGQCGGQGWSGATTCASGSTCVASNQYYSQCLPSTGTTGGGGGTSPSSTVSGSSPTSGAGCSSRTKFKYFGVNESGAEFGTTAIPGQLNKDYTWPAPTSIDYFMSNGFNFFRVPFLMERMSPVSTGLSGPFNSTYLSGLQTTVSYITGKGGFVAIDPHNYMRYNNQIITSTSQFQSWWQTLASQFKSNTNVIFDIQNEPYGIDATTVASLNQAAINGIRASGATSQLILAEGTSYTGAWTWTSAGNAAAFTGLKDPNNNLAIEMHQYLDSDGSGTSATCVNNTIGVNRLQDATNWLKANNLKGFLGEMGAGNNTVCAQAVSGALCEMQQSGVWIGFSWWAAGPWWGTYYQSIEPPSGPAVSEYVPLFKSYQ